MISLADRHRIILEKIKKEGKVNVLDLCEMLDVSSVTIRKDLKQLEDKNLLFRIHGGATLNNPYTMDRPVNVKEKLQTEEKNKIGITAASLIEPNDSIIIASGTTVMALARHIKTKESLTVITSAIQVAEVLLQNPEVDVLMLGGLLRKSSSSVMGPYAEEILKDFFCSKLFVGVDGIDLENGLTTTNVMEAHLNRQMMSVSNKTIVLADSSKFGKRGFGKICDIDEIDQIITDDGISPHTVDQLEAKGVKVIVV
ncbi:DeoR/GlpR family DNA-binding transcription regulator [Albibacterium indicum]|uniref:DeoR/GlpR family DNA-binding transcription regulator n=1 Tax=Albibacterium indicum TaxID=2292082 RepID=UPI000E49D392|nr:DeoR/GlpR family DNA-binding transcription regulator [Pedobacter indicus]